MRKFIDLHTHSTESDGSCTPAELVKLALEKIAQIEKFEATEEEIDQMRKDLIDDHFDRLNRGECQPQNSGVFVNLVNNLERAADHMIYIAYSVKEAFDQAKNK